MAGTLDIKLDPKYDDYDFPVKSPFPGVGQPGYLTEMQQAQIDQLRMMLEAEGFTKRLDTLTLLRFLRARKFDVTASKKMFVECEAWRKEVNLDDQVASWEYPEKEQMFKFYPQYYHKTDKDGRPVYIEQLGKIDYNSMLKITTQDRMVLNLAVEYERLADPRLPACSRKSGHLLETCSTIMDLKGVGIWKAQDVFAYIKAVSAVSQNCYPERLGKLYLINTSWAFTKVLNIVKGWLDPVTQSKIHDLGSSYQKELLAQIPAENLPKAFGGECECPGGCELSDMGPWREEQWARPAKWEKKEAKKDDAITNEAAGGPAGAATPATSAHVAAAPAMSAHVAAAPAPAGVGAPAPVAV